MTYPNSPTPMSMPGAQQAAAAAQGQPLAGAAGAPGQPLPGAAGAPDPGAPGQQVPGGAPAATAAAAPVSAGGGQPQTPPPPTAAPPWGSDEEFNPQRAWDLIQNLRGDKEILQHQLSSAQPILDEHERLRQASLSDNERLTEQLSQATSRGDTWRAQAVRSTVTAMAAGRFVDTETALALIGDLSQFVDGDDIDAAKITSALDKLATDKPFLVSQPGQSPPPGFTPNPAQGQSGAGQPGALDAQIKAAQDRGDFATSIALKQQKLLNKS